MRGGERSMGGSSKKKTPQWREGISCKKKRENGSGGKTCRKKRGMQNEDDIPKGQGHLWQRQSQAVDRGAVIEKHSFSWAREIFKGWEGSVRGGKYNYTSNT